MERESMEYDVVIIGGGPAGLAAAIRLKQCAADAGMELGVCLIEKGSEIGAHILSGAVFEPRALDELIPDWQAKGAPLDTPAGREDFTLLTRSRAIPLPIPPQMKNRGNYIISLGNLVRWLAGEAESLGVEIYPGFAAAEILHHPETGAVRGIATGDMGIAKDNTRTEGFRPGIEILGRQVIFAEGCRGHLTKQLMARFDLGRDCDPQTYGIGLKEIWEIDPAKSHPGQIRHTIGWPLPADTYGGSFLYHMGEGRLACGFVIGLDYTNPHLSPFDEFQRFKTHPAIRPLFEGGRRIAYGARALTEGGYQSIPRLSFPGGCLAGCGAGFMNVAKIKGSHTAMKSGMCAAEAVFEALTAEGAAGAGGMEPRTLEAKIKASWINDELFRVRNIRPGFRAGLWGGMAAAAFDTYIMRGRAPWTLHHHADHTALLPAGSAPRIDYPKPDNKVTFDRASSLFLSGVNHAENQPCHLHLRDPDAAIRHNLALFDAPEQRYCPAGVYEIIRDEGGGEPRLRINAQNCVHCKTCDIKDPGQNINWVAPEGGGGPNYGDM